MREFKLSYIKGMVETRLYNQIVDITGDSEDIDYSSIEAIINYSIDLIADFSWNCAVNFFKDDMKKFIKENNENEVSAV